MSTALVARKPYKDIAKAVTTTRNYARKFQIRKAVKYKSPNREKVSKKMAIVNLHGYQVLDFETKEGDVIKGMKLFISYQDDNVEGYRTDDKFISFAKCQQLGLNADVLKPYLNQVVDIQLDLKGKIVSVQPVE